MSSAHQFACLQSLEENYHEVHVSQLFIVFCNIGNCLWKGLNVYWIFSMYVI